MNKPLAAVACIAFDLDGTLIDSAPDIAYALNQALSLAGFDTFDIERVRRWVGDGPDTLIARSLRAQGLDRPVDDLLTSLRQSFDAATLGAPLARGRVYPGIPELLKTLHGRLPLAVATNKPTTLARVVLEAAGLLELFSSVHGADGPQLRKPRPDLLIRIAGQLEVRPAQLLMVGDGPADVGAARAAGCPAALVHWGYAQQAVAADPDLLHVAAPSDLLELLSECEAFTAGSSTRSASCPPAASPR